MRKVGLVLVLVLLLAPITFAKPENLTVGRFNISFDLGTTLWYTRSIEGPTPYETYSGIKNNYSTLDILFDNGKGKIKIIIIDYDQIMDASPEYCKQDIQDAFQSFGARSSIYDREIDGNEGVLGVGFYGPTTIYQAKYWPFSQCLKSGKYLGFSQCSIISYCDWYITKNLLNTIHIEANKSKTNAS